MDLLAKKTYGYRQRDEAKRKEFIEQLSSQQPEQIVYVDEAGIDNRQEYEYGYCEVGERFHTLNSGKPSERVSWISALKQSQLFAPMTFEGSCNHDLFEMWLGECLLPRLTPGDVIVSSLMATNPWRMYCCCRGKIGIITLKKPIQFMQMWEY
ncbi:MAG: hypothetical protein HC851_20895 [Acaryochloris sp. RU_4_1]|nr:hypothetical protein [Acaryochloris sp. RU_4_1]NJR56647.1 hypothetical protein [Acaryochloris sp. CRU_2_0]